MINTNNSRRRTIGSWDLSHKSSVRKPIKVSGEFSFLQLESSLKRHKKNKSSVSSDRSSTGRSRTSASPAQRRKSLVKNESNRKKFLVFEQHLKKKKRLLQEEVERRDACIIEMFQKGERYFVLEDLHNELQKKDIYLQDLIGNKKTVNVNEFCEQLRNHGIESFQELEKLLPSSIPSELLMAIYSKRNQVPTLSLNDLNMKMQMHSIPRVKFINALFGSEFKGKVNESILLRIITNSPFNIKEPDNLASFLMGSKQVTTIEKVKNKLLRFTEDSKVFNSKEEEY